MFVTEFQRWRVVTHANAKSKSEKFPPPHQDGPPLEASHKGPVSFGATNASFGSIVNSKPSGSEGSHDAAGPHKGKKTNKSDSWMTSSWKIKRGFMPSSFRSK